MTKTLNFFNKITFIIFCFSTILSCSYKPVVKTNGIQNLDKRTELMTVGTTNKNDIIQLIGHTILKEQPNENIWAYVETVEQKKFGKKKVIKNTLLILEFDSRGVLKNKKILNKNDFNKLKFDEASTVTYGLNNSFSKRIFSSIRKRAQNRLDTLTK
jgi:outer membrane protein assembly factor BamE (lipoprotein component of BamABCDE complex)